MKTGNSQIQSKKRRNKVIGNLGEDIAAKHLKNKGFAVLERNYLRKWGELDIVARETVENGTKVHFVEVKAVSYETNANLEYAVSHDTYRPEENVHQFKLHQIHKALETWIMENKYKGNWQIDVITVRMVPREKFAQVNYLENIVD